jgi:hypothetical protein
MSKITVQVEVAKEVHEIAILLCSLISQLVNKVPLTQIAANDLVKLEAALGGLSEVSNELNGDLAAVQKSFMLPLADMIAALVKKTPIVLPAPPIKTV